MEFLREASRDNPDDALVPVRISKNKGWVIVRIIVFLDLPQSPQIDALFQRFSLIIQTIKVGGQFHGAVFFLRDQ